MRKTISILMLAMLLLFVISACGNSDVYDSSNSTPNSSSNKVEDDSVWAFKIDTITLGGDAVTDEDFYDNKLTVLNIWATWCPPCVGELPHLQEVNEKFKDKGVEIVGVLQDGVDKKMKPNKSTIKKGIKLLNDSGAKYKVILPDESLTNEFISEMQYFPTTFFINSAGEVVKVAVGAKDAEGWEDTINQVLKEIR